MRMLYSYATPHEKDLYQANDMHKAISYWCPCCNTDEAVDYRRGSVPDLNKPALLSNTTASTHTLYPGINAICPATPQGHFKNIIISTRNLRTMLANSCICHAFCSKVAVILDTTAIVTHHSIPSMLLWRAAEEQLKQLKGPVRRAQAAHLPLLTTDTPFSEVFNRQAPLLVALKQSRVSIRARTDLYMLSKVYAVGI